MHTLGRFAGGESSSTGGLFLEGGVGRADPCVGTSCKRVGGGGREGGGLSAWVGITEGGCLGTDTSRFPKPGRLLLHSPGTK